MSFACKIINHEARNEDDERKMRAFVWQTIEINLSNYTILPHQPANIHRTEGVVCVIEWGGLSRD